MNIRVLSLFILSIISTNLYASQASIWRGNNYALGNQSATTLRFDQSNQWRYGDGFYFFEITNPDNKGTSIYGEVQPRLSFSKITKHKISFGPVSDVLAAAELNVSGNNSRAYLYGMGVNLEVPTFTFVKLNVYARKNPAQPGNTYQISLSWLNKIKLSKRYHVLFAGFIDKAGKQGTLASNFLAKPRLLLDLGRALNKKSDSYYAGVQYAYWKNKLGIKNLNESVIEAMFTWKF